MSGDIGGRLTEGSRQLTEVMARTASTYGKVGPDFFTVAAEGLISHCRPPSRGRVLDVGCGPGTVASLLCQRPGPQPFVVLVDLVPEMVREAEIRLRPLTPHTCLVVMDAQVLAFGNEVFDAVISAGTVYQIPDAPRAVREMLRVLCGGGLLGLSAFTGRDPRWSRLVGLYARHASPLAPAGRAYDGVGLGDLLAGAGAAGVRVASQQLDISYRDADEWLANAWSHGERRALESMNAYSYDLFRRELPAALEPAREVDGRLHSRVLAVYASGRRPDPE